VRRPERIPAVVLVFVILGWVILRRRRDVELRNPDDGEQSYFLVPLSWPQSPGSSGDDRFG
jgi:hypothetical protein